MLRLLVKLALGAAVVAAVWSWVPISGRTLAARYRSAGSVPTLVERGWSELTANWGDDRAVDDRAGARAQARAGPRERPTEAHTDADRRAVDRILSDHLRDAR